MPSVQSVVIFPLRGEREENHGLQDNTDKEGIAVPGVFTRRVAAKEVLDHDEARSHPVIRGF